MRTLPRLLAPAGFAILLLSAWLVWPVQSRPAAGPHERPGVLYPSAPADIQINVDQIVAGSFSNPLGLYHAGDGSGRLFVVEQGGRIWIIQGGQRLPTPFLDISSLISTAPERGLLGLAFHPNYENNGYFYINYTRAGDGATVIARYQVAAGNSNQANPNSAFPLLSIAQPYANHNGGQIAFGPDGYLYIGMGDGGSGGDPQNYAQNIDSLLGKLLRIDVNSGSPYGIPPDNPYVNAPGADEIWALGLRNPWRFSFDRQTGDIYIGDVGQNLWEEIDYQPYGAQGGRNYGWRCKEGAHPFNDEPPCNNPAFLATLIDPIAEYNHGEGQSVTGGFVYRGLLYPALAGRYFYADYVTGKIWSMYKTGANSWSIPEPELDTNFNISSFGEDETGELYVVDRTNDVIRRLIDPNQGANPPDLSQSSKIASQSTAMPGDLIDFTITLSNTGGLSARTHQMIDTVPAGLAYIPGSLKASSGSVNASGGSILSWQGALAPEPLITITYQVNVTGAVSGTLVNQAEISGPDIAALTLRAGIIVSHPAITPTLSDLFVPGTQPGQLRDLLPVPGSCDVCHTEPIYDRWRGSMMGQAGRDPLFWSALAVANSDAPGSGEFCLRCHTPKGWLEGRSVAADGSLLQPADIEAGVTCALCHRMVDPVPSAADLPIDIAARAILTAPLPATQVGSAMLIVDPDDNRRGPFTLAPGFSLHTANRTPFLGGTTDNLTRARLCGSCHNIDNPLLSWDPVRGQYWPNAAGQPAPSFEQGDLFPIETTFDEWRYSDYAIGAGVFAPQFAGAKPDGMVGACQDCHMTRATGIAAEAVLNPFFRDCQTTGCLPVHDLAGANTWLPQILQDERWRLHEPSDSPYLNAALELARDMLHKSAAITITLSEAGQGSRTATVRVVNQTGHKLPTGYVEGRRMWLNLKAYNAAGQLIYESGAYNPQTASLTADPAVKIYEAHQGLTPELAAELGLASGPSFHFVLNNTVYKDNRIPPRGYTQTAYDRIGLRPVGAVYQDGQYWDDTFYTVPAETVRVTVTLYYQTASKEYIDFLRQNGGLDGFTLGQLWDASKSPPEPVASAQYIEPGALAGINFLPLLVR